MDELDGLGARKIRKHVREVRACETRRMMGRGETEVDGAHRV